jgi:uncharacterized protein YkwD
MRRAADADAAVCADPHRVSLRLSKLALVFSMLVAVAAGYLALPGSAQSVAHARNAAVEQPSLDRGVLDQLNAIRRLHGLVPLKLDASLNASAAQHSAEMGADGYFEHDSADGTIFWKRIQRYFGATSYTYWSVGENLLWSAPSVDPLQAARLWMASPEHRKNILDPRWRLIGISSVHLDTAPGTYKGLPVTIITTDFGVRR